MFFDEDRQRKRNKKLTENFSFIGKISLNLLKQEVLKGLLVSKRLKSGWDDNFLMQLVKAPVRIEESFLSVRDNSSVIVI